MAERITGWRAYFADGTIATSKTVRNWVDLPSDGMLGLVVFFDSGKKRRITGGDYYHLNIAQGKYGMDRGDAAELALRYPGAFLVRGIWTDDENMKRVEARMKSDAAP